MPDFLKDQILKHSNLLSVKLLQENLVLAFVFRMFHKEYVTCSIYSLSGYEILNCSICILFKILTEHIVLFILQ